MWIYAQAGHYMYGADLDDYSSVSASFQSCFDILLGRGDFQEMKRVADLGTTIFYWSLIVLGLMVGMNIIITSEFSCARTLISCCYLTCYYATPYWPHLSVCVLRSTVLMGGFERANSVTDAAAPTFSEFIYYIFREFAPPSVIQSFDATPWAPKGRFKKAVELVMQGTPSPRSQGERSPDSAESADEREMEASIESPSLRQSVNSDSELETIRDELHAKVDSIDSKVDSIGAQVEEMKAMIAQLVALQAGGAAAPATS